ncbi:FAD-binding oxidoreductase [Cyanobacteria bacterium FACHB-471]|nr:FAD-binding oxidoreductase [Cyanobacteria bacterium FACHB-471]
MTHVVVVGCGVVGAAIAYELSQIPDLSITVLDRQPPAQAATGAALGVLMGAISQKVKGNAWRMRQFSIQRYETLIPELEAIAQQPISYNRQGILMLCFDVETLPRWQQLAETRQTQGWQLEIWDREKLRCCPQVNPEKVLAAIYSPQDRQVDPTTLTLALVKAAQTKGVTFHFDAQVLGLKSTANESQTCQQVQTTAGNFSADWVVIAAGLGSTLLTQAGIQPVDIRPVLGQALQLQLENPLGDRNFQPVITGDDIHLVPLGNEQYWVGATVEFPNDAGEVSADSAQLDAVLEGAIALCPALAQAKILKTWSGLRPRPYGRPAPIIEPLPGYTNVLLATGHYRNGVLLAPATAQAVCDLLAK